MPCNTVSTMEIELGKLNAGLALDALKLTGATIYQEAATGLVQFSGGSLGDYGTLDLTKGALTLAGSSLTQPEATAALKRAYSEASLRETAKRNRWELKKTADNQYQITRRF